MSASGSSSGNSTSGSTSADAAGTGASQPITYFPWPAQICGMQLSTRTTSTAKVKDFSTHAGQRHSVEQLDDGTANSWISEYNNSLRRKNVRLRLQTAHPSPPVPEGAELQPLGDGQHLVYMLTTTTATALPILPSAGPVWYPASIQLPRGPFRYKSRFTCIV